MKKKLFLLVILIMIFIVVVGVRFFIMDTQNSYGRIKILSSPSAGVFIDNVALGKTPFEDKYKVGEYFLKLIPEGDATQTASWQGKIRIYKNALTFVNRELGTSDLNSSGEIFTVTKMEKPPRNGNYGEIYVETEPSGAIVYLDNDEKGVASLILSEVLKGDHELSVFMPGFFRRTQKINIDSGYRVNASFKLALDESQQQQKPQPVATESAGTSPTPLKTPGPTEAADDGRTDIVILENEFGFLRVREEPSISASESARVKPGQKFELLKEENGWYQIKYDGKNTGWVYSQYAEKE